MVPDISGAIAAGSFSSLFTAVLDQGSTTPKKPISTEVAEPTVTPPAPAARPAGAALPTHDQASSLANTGKKKKKKEKEKEKPAAARLGGEKGPPVEPVVGDEFEDLPAIQRRLAEKEARYQAEKRERLAAKELRRQAFLKEQAAAHPGGGATTGQREQLLGSSSVPIDAATQATEPAAAADSAVRCP